MFTKKKRVELKSHLSGTPELIEESRDVPVAIVIAPVSFRNHWKIISREASDKKIEEIMFHELRTEDLALPRLREHGMAQPVQQLSSNPVQLQSDFQTTEQDGQSALTQVLRIVSKLKPERRRLIQRQLILILHACNCNLRSQNQAYGEPWQCDSPHCYITNKLLNHLSTCQEGLNCTVPRCRLSALIIIYHWNNCTSNDCPICSQLTKAERNWDPSTSGPKNNTNNNDPDKRKLIQQQLRLILHARYCQQRENQANGRPWRCNLRNSCDTMKNVLKHISTCQVGKNCTVSYCNSSTMISRHWDNCTHNNCMICSPLKQAERNRLLSESESENYMNNNDSDPEKRKLIRQQLWLILHARNCQQRQNQAKNRHWHCNLFNCSTMKNVLNHLSTCQAGKNCAVSYCNSTAAIIKHWDNCIRNNCLICSPLSF